MAKRKAAVNDIIYELDNDDIVISSEDEEDGNKRKHFVTKSSSGVPLSKQITDINTEDVVLINSSQEDSYNTDSENSIDNGGKSSPDVMFIENNKNAINDIGLNSAITPLVNRPQKSNADGPQTIILNEDIAIDSPVSSNGIKVGGCENKTPLISVHFKTKKLENLYKDKIKSFIVELLNCDDVDSESENGLDLEIRPEDINNIKPKTQKDDADESLFFVDTDPRKNTKSDVPKYTHASTVISNKKQEESVPSETLRRGPVCFNCDGDHLLRDCQLPRNNVRIAEKRKAIANKQGRYHVEDEQKYGQLIPGRISSQLRHALGLKRYELPLHIYRMRMLGYPPGWLEEARISHSGIAMFDSAGNPILDDDDEEGLICEDGYKDKFDIKKILDFPGFNVPASSRYREESHILDMPPMSEQDSKLLMLETLAPNAMKAYKRKKLNFFPSTPNSSFQNSQAEMDLDSEDEIAEFPTVPPLPDEAPPPLPPPPPPQDPVSPQREHSKPDEEKVKQNMQNVSQDVKETVDKEQDKTFEKEMFEATTNTDIPTLNEEFIVIDEYFEKSQCESDGDGSSLDDLEQRKQKLLDELQSGTSSNVNITSVIEDQVSEGDVQIIEEDKEVNEIDVKRSEIVSTSEGISSSVEEQVSTDNILNKPSNLDTSSSKIKTGFVKTTLYGTPVLNIVSPYLKLPSEDKFAKDICDVIYFENLPNSTGNYKKISTLLKKVKSEVEKIQES